MNTKAMTSGNGETKSPITDRLVDGIQARKNARGFYVPEDIKDLADHARQLEALSHREAGTVRDNLRTFLRQRVTAYDVTAEGSRIHGDGFMLLLRNKVLYLLGPKESFDAAIDRLLSASPPESQGEKEGEWPEIDSPYPTQTTACRECGMEYPNHAIGCSLQARWKP